MTTAYRLYVTFKQSSCNFRVQGHHTDPTKLGVKAYQPEAMDAFAMVSGADLGVLESFKGHKYYITFVDKEKFCKALAGYCASIAAVKLPEEKPSHLKVVEVPPEAQPYDNDDDKFSEEPEDESDVDDDDDDDDDANVD